MHVPCVFCHFCVTFPVCCDRHPPVLWITPCSNSSMLTPTFMGRVQFYKDFHEQKTGAAEEHRYYSFLNVSAVGSQIVHFFLTFCLVSNLLPSRHFRNRILSIPQPQHDGQNTVKILTFHIATLLTFEGHHNFAQMIISPTVKFHYSYVFPLNFNLKETIFVMAETTDNSLRFTYTTTNIPAMANKILSFRANVRKNSSVSIILT